MKLVLNLFCLLLLLDMQAQRPGKSVDSTVSFTVFGNCEMCEKRIEDAASGKGVRDPQWDAGTKILTLTYNPRLTSLDKIHSRIAAVGHDTPLKTAPDEVYVNLPDCCLYRSGACGEGEAANTIFGVVMEVDAKGNNKPLPAATIQINNTEAGTTTNENGYFKIGPIEKPGTLQVSFVGYQASIIPVEPGQHLWIVLDEAKVLQEVRVVSGKGASFVSAVSPFRVQQMTEKELFKAACCNIGESFETNPSVDVSFSDGLTGAKQIQLLGLSGQYVQLTQENLPGPRGLAYPFGLNSIPGPWLESIQLSKGVGTVVNGFESIAGQVNLELKKPESGKPLFLNLYRNNMGKTDLNLNLSHQFSKKWSTALFLHDAFLNRTDVDFNEDGFRDLPSGNLFTVLNRWKYSSGKNTEAQIGVRLLTDQKTAGHINFDPEKHQGITDPYGTEVSTNRFEVFGKWGYVFPQKKYKSIGLQLSAFVHDQDASFGMREYKGKQTNLYGNLIYQSIISNTNHQFRTGLNFVQDDYEELFLSANYDRLERTAGAFFEYTGKFGEKWEAVAGIRGDHNNLFGFFVTPRLHLKYRPTTRAVFRLSAGRGQRTANIFAENMSLMVSSRSLNLLNTAPGKAYGLDPEIAWNVGLTYDQRFKLWNRDGNIAVDFYYTHFQNQVIVDLDQSARRVDIYNSLGKSYSQSFQVELNYKLATPLDIRLSYRYFNVQQDYQGKKLQRYLLSPHRAFLNLAFEKGRWKADATVSYNSSRRIPYTGDNPVALRWDEKSPDYLVVNTQVTRSFGRQKNWDIYFGIENLGNFIQVHRIIDPQTPFGPYFDGSLIWGPLSGRMGYLGLRYTLGNKL